MVYLMVSISACVVTYNRPEEVCVCISKLIQQSLPLTNILIYDNASTEDTPRKIEHLLSCVIERGTKLQNIYRTGNTIIWYVRAEHNTGGAGGFHDSVKISRERFATDYYWLMDDDGYPSHNCLEILLAEAQTSNLDYIMPVSIDIKDHSKLSWPTRMKNGKKTERYNELKDSWGKEMDYITPFNGSLMSVKCVDNVGYVNKRFFIWGDEYEHYWRCKSHKITPVTLLEAEFYHPALKLPMVPIFGGMIKIPYVDSALRMVCLTRNYTYIYMHYDNKLKIPVKFLLYAWLFIVHRKLDFKGLWLYCLSVKDGLIGDFERHKKYLKK
jgi:rhamnopyranosyl-N-acetylglucosaminyl-diphospho-decaprenol beta-1,3/1,4-galactofuranosyltransferase